MVLKFSELSLSLFSSINGAAEDRLTVQSANLVLLCETYRLKPHSEHDGQFALDKKEFRPFRWTILLDLSFSSA